MLSHEEKGHIVKDPRECMYIDWFGLLVVLRHINVSEQKVIFPCYYMDQTNIT